MTERSMDPGNCKWIEDTNYNILIISRQCSNGA
jgi:hypothetical protein